MSKKIHLFPVASDADAAVNTNLTVIGDPATGLLKQATVQQAKKAYGTFAHKYTATGSEGTVITIGLLLSKDIVAIFREGAALYEVDSAPDTVEFVWAGTDIELGLATNPGERFLILYKSQP